MTILIRTRKMSTHLSSQTSKSVYFLCVFVLTAVSSSDINVGPKFLEEECNTSGESPNGKDCDFPTDYDDDRGLRTGAVIGIVFGSLALATAVGLLCCFCFGCCCFKKHFYRKNKNEVLSATTRSHHRSQRQASLSQVQPNNEAKIVIEPIPNPTFINPGQNQDHSSPDISPNQNDQYTNHLHASISATRRTSDDNSAYWGGYEDSMNGENIYSEPEYANQPPAPPSYYGQINGDHRQIAVIDGTVFHQGMYNQPPPSYFSHGGNTNGGFVSSEEQPQLFGAQAKVDSSSKYRLTEL